MTTNDYLMTTTSHHLKATGKATGTFYFKQFKVEDSRSTMKVGTDAVLLGARVEIGNAGNILEIGTGCGVIALILAQRSQARIDAIDIDADSVNQADENVKRSRWNDHIRVYHNSLQDFSHQTDNRYDLVVSNPPFFLRSLKSSKKTRNISRHNDSLSFEELIIGSSRLMMPDAGLWVILPVKESQIFTDIALNQGLLVHYILKISPKYGSGIKRHILQLKKVPVENTREEKLVIKNEDNSYTRDYIELTKEFYLDF
jgi:tRNA1Val (adenine37-N6)-methyltransferase